MSSAETGVQIFTPVYGKGHSENNDNPGTRENLSIDMEPKEANNDNKEINEDANNETRKYLLCAMSVVECSTRPISQSIHDDRKKTMNKQIAQCPNQSETI